MDVAEMTHSIVEDFPNKIKDIGLAESGRKALEIERYRGGGVVTG